MRRVGAALRAACAVAVASSVLALGIAGALLGASAAHASAGGAAPDPEAVERGRRVLQATGGCTCHTNYPVEGEAAPALAGGRAMETPFGVFYSTNITPDRETGIGGWSEADFVRAMREGLSPEGEHYFPVFPYTAFSGLTDADLADLRAYLLSLPPVRRENRAPEAPFPFSWRGSIAGWKWLHFTPFVFEPEPGRSDAWHRGRYLVNAAAHCGECHTPRTLTGGLDRTRWLAGSRDGPEGELAPNITPDEATGIGSWDRADLVWYLETGLKPDGDDTQGLMSEVIEHGYAHLPRADLEAIAEYLATLPAVENRVKGE